MPPGDHRYDCFHLPVTKDGLAKLPELGFLQTPSRSMVQAAMRFVPDHPGVSSVIAGAKTRQQIEEKYRGLGTTQLDPAGTRARRGSYRHHWYTRMEPLSIHATGGCWCLARRRRTLPAPGPPEQRQASEDGRA